MRLAPEGRRTRRGAGGGVVRQAGHERGEPRRGRSGMAAGIGEGCEDYTVSVHWMEARGKSGSGGGRVACGL